MTITREQLLGALTQIRDIIAGVPPTPGPSPTPPPPPPAPPTTITAWSISPASVVGGLPATGTLTISAAAPTGGTVVTLASADPATVSVPATVTVPAGSTSVPVAVTTSVVAVGATVQVSATLGTSTLTAPLAVSVAPPVVPPLTALSVVPASVQGGASGTATVTLGAAAPTGGTAVALASDTPAVASIPASVTVTAGQTTANASITTVPVVTTTPVVFTATLAGSPDRTASLTVVPPPPTGTPVRLSGLGLPLSTDFSTVSSPAQLTGTAAQGKPFVPNSLGYNLVSLDQSVLYDGHQTLRLSFPPSVTSYPKLLQFLGVSYPDLWIRRVWRYSPGFTSVGDGTTWNGATWIPSAAAYKAGPFFSEANGGSRAGLELVQGLSGGVYGTEVQLGHHWNNVADSDQFGRGHTHGAFMASGAWIDSVLHFQIDPTEPKRAFVSYWEATAGSPLVLIYDNIYSLDDDANHPLAGSVQWALNYNQRRRADQTDLAVWYAMLEVVDGSVHANPYGL
jgi:hypothetical protein